MTSPERVVGGVRPVGPTDPILLASVLGAMCADHDEVDDTAESRGGDASPRQQAGER